MNESRPGCLSRQRWNFTPRPRVRLSLDWSLRLEAAAATRIRELCLSPRPIARRLAPTPAHTFSLGDHRGTCLCDRVTIHTLLFDRKVGERRPPERVVAAILASGVEKEVAFGQCVPATDDEAHALCRLIERCVELHHSPLYEDAHELINMMDASCSRFAIYGWNAAKLPKELSDGDAPSVHELRLRQAIDLGFDPATRRVPGMSRKSWRRSWAWNRDKPQ